MPGIILNAARARRAIDSKNGFTIFEILIALTIGITLIGLLLSIYTLSTKSMVSGQNRAELTQTARSAVERITRDIREARAITSPLPPDPDDPDNPPLDEIQLEDGHTGELQYIRYYRDATDIWRQVLQYAFASDPGVPVPYNSEDEFGNPPDMTILSDRKIGQYGQSMQFYGTDVIYVELTLNKGTITHTTKTALYGHNL